MKQQGGQALTTITALISATCRVAPRLWAWVFFSLSFCHRPFSGVVCHGPWYMCIYIIIIRSSRASGRGRWSSVPLNWTHLHSFSPQRKIHLPPPFLAACQSCESNGGTHGKVFPAHRESCSKSPHVSAFPHFYNSTIPHFPFPYRRESESGAFAFASVHNLYA